MRQAMDSRMVAEIEEVVGGRHRFWDSHLIW
jgi:hypothetical protein